MSKSRGFTLLEIVLYLGILGTLTGAAIAGYSDWQDRQRVYRSLNDFSIFVDKSINLRAKFGGDFSTANTEDITLYTGYGDHQIVGTGAAARIKNDVGGVFSVRPYILLAVPQGIIVRATVDDANACFAFLSGTRGVSMHTQKILMDTVVAYDQQLGIESFISTATARCAISGQHYVDLYLNTNNSGL